MINGMSPPQSEGAPKETWDELNDMKIDAHNIANDTLQGRKPQRFYTKENERAALTGEKKEKPVGYGSVDEMMKAEK